MLSKRLKVPTKIGVITIYSLGQSTRFYGSMECLGSWKLNRNDVMSIDLDNLDKLYINNSTVIFHHLKQGVFGIVTPQTILPWFGRRRPLRFTPPALQYSVVPVGLRDQRWSTAHFLVPKIEVLYLSKGHFWGQKKLGDMPAYGETFIFWYHQFTWNGDLIILMHSVCELENHHL